MVEDYYEEEGNRVCREYYCGRTCWREFTYNQDNQLVHSVDSEGCEVLLEYDEQGKLVHYKRNNGGEKDSTGFECWVERDERGNITHYRDSDGFAVWNVYDDKNNLVNSRKITPGSRVKDNTGPNEKFCPNGQVEE